MGAGHRAQGSGCWGEKKGKKKYLMMDRNILYLIGLLLIRKNGTP
jgi:hypothetical protein